MPLRRAFMALLLLPALLAVPAHAAEAPAKKKKPAAASASRLPAKRAPAAKAFTTKKSSKAAKSRTSATRTSGRPRTTSPGHIRTLVVTPHVDRQELIGEITHSLASPRVALENPRALRPFFDQLHQLELSRTAAPDKPVVRIVQYGDSHTAADLFTGALRTLFQSRWGDAGAGYSYPGYPFAGYRIHGTKRSQSTGWTVAGTHFRDLGYDLPLGMGGVSLTTYQAGSWVSLEADASSLEVQYLTQPGGGSIAIYDNDILLTQLPTDGTVTAAGHFDTPVSPGPHRFEVRTLTHAPVTLLGLVTENAAGTTYEAIGLNGAEAGLITHWDADLQQTYLTQRDPALIVLAYGTNEAADHTWTEQTYATLLRTLVARCRRQAPHAAILVLGPADRDLRAGRAGWAPFAGNDRIVAAQRAVCKELGCAYWDQRARMGGFGSMHQWVSVQWAQADHTHFTGEGYTELASALFSDIVQQYDTYEGSASTAEGIAK